MKIGRPGKDEYDVPALSGGMKRCMVKPVNYKIEEVYRKRRKPGSIHRLVTRLSGRTPIQTQSPQKEDILTGHAFYQPGYSWCQENYKTLGLGSTVSLGRGGLQGYSNQDITEANKNKRRMEKTQLLVVLTHPPPEGSLEGQEDWTDHQGATWAGTSVPFVRRGTPEECPELPGVWWLRATVVSPNSCAFLRREILHISWWGWHLCGSRSASPSPILVQSSGSPLACGKAEHRPTWATILTWPSQPLSNHDCSDRSWWMKVSNLCLSLTIIIRSVIITPFCICQNACLPPRRDLLNKLGLVYS